jgi:protein-S-isoprenylcysteine O-methyltransferase Ste14
MTDGEAPAYGLWGLVAANSLVLLLFAFSFARPRGPRDWRSFGAFSAFIVALFAEMYGFPLTIYFLAGWLQSRYPALDPFSHGAGHLWQTLFGLSGDPHFSWLHIASNMLILAALVLLGISWWFLYRAQRRGRVATEGPYALVQHPQYVAFVAIMIGFLLQWPTLLTLAMFPVLAAMYGYLAGREEDEMEACHGEEYRRYALRTPRFVPWPRRWDANSGA